MLLTAARPGPLKVSALRSGEQRDGMDTDKRTDMSEDTGLASVFIFLLLIFPSVCGAALHWVK